MAALLEVSDLRVRFAEDIEALRGVNFTLEHGESLTVVGESGAGKSTLAHCLVGLVGAPQATGSVRLTGRELIGATPERLRALRWSTAAIALQSVPFNPVVTVGRQLAEPLREKGEMSRAEAAVRVAQLARELSLDPALLECYPHELSGGEKRRAMLAMVLALDPELVILDEPTAGLDPGARRELIDRVSALARDRGFALLTISHDLSAAAQMGERCMVLYAGEAMEAGASSLVIGAPAHPYSRALLNAYPAMSTTKDLRPIRGHAPDPRAVLSGCPFHPRCTQAEAVCEAEHPPLSPSRERLVACHFGGVRQLLRAVDLHMTFRRGGRAAAALQGVSFELAEGEAVGLVGPSGSGKTTLARILAGHLAPDSGELVLEGAAGARAMRRRIQLVMQDPWDALSPRLDVEELVREPLDVGFGEAGDARQRAAAVASILESVGLPPSGAFLRARAHELSGGQLQRIALARALIGRPKLLVADEPTSLLDASEQARLLVILRELQVEMGLALVLVSHDMAVVRKVTDRIVVLDGGRVVEEGRSEVVSADPRSLTARRLVADS